MSELKAVEYQRFEDIRHLREDGSEYWSARELGPALDYAKWENFSKVIKRAVIACKNSGHSISDDFPEVRKIVEAGATTKPTKDYELSSKLKGSRLNGCRPRRKRDSSCWTSNVRFLNIAFICRGRIE